RSSLSIRDPNFCQTLENIPITTTNGAKILYRIGRIMLSAYRHTHSIRLTHPQGLLDWSRSSEMTSPMFYPAQCNEDRYSRPIVRSNIRLLNACPLLTRFHTSPNIPLNRDSTWVQGSTANSGVTNTWFLETTCRWPLSSLICSN